MEDLTSLLFDFPAVCRKKVTGAFDGGNVSSNGGLLLVREIERRQGLAQRLSDCLRDRRGATRIEHTQAEMLRMRMLAITAGYEDADDCDALRHDPIMKMAVGREPESGAALCSQPTMSRLENAPSRIEVARMMIAMLEVFFDSFKKAPKRIVLDVDDTLDAAHGGQQLSLFNAHYDERCFLPIHIYEAISGKLVAAILRAGKTPSGEEVRTILKHLIRRIRARWPKVAIVIRGDSHYGRIEVMDWCDSMGIDYILGLSVNAVLRRMIESHADPIRVRRAVSGADKVRGFCSLKYGAKNWGRPRRVVARMEATTQGFDTRYVVTSMRGSPKYLYEKVYCQRGQMENLIKLHKSQLASDRTSCHSATANQFRLILHSCAYWLSYDLRAAIPKQSGWARVEFTTLRAKLIKIAARVTETVARIRVSFPSSCPDMAIFIALAGRLRARPP